MARPLRLEVEDGIYHLTARGNERAMIFRDDPDRERFLEILAGTHRRFGWRCLAYCLMGNHYHLLLRTPQANLSRGMRDLNGMYAQWFNRRHGRVGHLFQGRYRAILIEGDEHLLAALAYVVRNPVRAGLCAEPRDWRWSSQRAALGERPPGLLALSELLGYLGPDRERARVRYRELTELEDEAKEASYGGRVVQGRDDFVRRMLAGIPSSPEIPSAQLRPPPAPLEEILVGSGMFEEIAVAYAAGHTMPAIARHLGLHPSTVSRRLARYRAQIKT